MHHEIERPLRDSPLNAAVRALVTQYARWGVFCLHRRRYRDSGGGNYKRVARHYRLERLALLPRCRERLAVLRGAHPPLPAPNDNSVLNLVYHSLGGGRTLLGLTVAHHHSSDAVIVAPERTIGLRGRAANRNGSPSTTAVSSGATPFRRGQLTVASRLPFSSRRNSCRTRTSRASTPASAMSALAGFGSSPSPTLWEDGRAATVTVFGEAFGMRPAPRTLSDQSVS